ncbi:N-acetylmuramoyl-L-alanine amidase [Pseudodesulfovibrio sp.]|uniref:N-acetylmuramoyl-L-alanine amidase n=1 Tax=Pseudodesulfovibrio sp. TaxID=2035812 RepID=UPI0026045088|nr:N-acetylmuramoyl-L-alanine amidase [Pseudodesulfovibrio sp.]MDD3312105.1 N-acetylmuramoyl-L-alanine amidase [Pseudodesulfovibrio sp.]
MKAQRRTALLPFPALALAAVLALLLCALPAPAASPQAAFTKGYNEFHALLKNRNKAKLRSNWDGAARRFSDCLKQDPDGPFAPKALYYLGRVQEELGLRSGLKSDFRRAEDYFGRVIARYPRHGWADDCLYRRAQIRVARLAEYDAARLDLARIIVEYPRSDMRAKADQALRKLGKYKWAVAEITAHPSGQPDSGLDAVVAEAEAKTGAPPIAKPAETAERAKDPSGLAHLDTVRYKSSDEYTRVVLELDDQVKYRYQVLKPDASVNRPHRLYVDIQGSRLGHDVKASTTVSDGILRSIRTGQYDKDTTRVVLDFLSMQDYKIFPLNNPFRIVIDVYSPEGGSDQPRAGAQAPAKAASSSRREEPHHTTADGKYRPPKGSKQHAGDLLEQLGLTVRTIMIDAGHGGKDPGAVANGLREKDVNLRFALLLGDKLAHKGFHVLYTRTTDVFIPLEQRTAMANVKKADLFISIHCNASTSRSAHGLETYSLNLAKSKDAVRIAARENAVDPRSISDLQFILTDLMVNSKIKESRDLAQDVQTNTLTRVRRKWQLNNKGTREAPFYVLMGAKMPSVLVELGYITNRTEAQRLSSAAYQDYLAQGIVDGVLAYKGKIERYAMK